MTTFNIAPAWEVVLGDVFGRKKALFEKFESMTLNLRRNDVGTFAITFADNGDDRLGEDYWPLDAQVLFVRDLPNYIDIDLKGGYFKSVQMQGLYRKASYSLSQSGERLITFEGVSPEHLLSRRIIAGLEGDIRSDKGGFASNVMCDYVNENCGPLANGESGRWFYIDVTDSESRVDADGVMKFFQVFYPRRPERSPEWTGSRSMQNLLDVIKDISAATRVDFYVEAIGEELYIFETFYDYGLGSDRSLTELNPSTGLNVFGHRPVVFSVDTETVENVEAVNDRMNEANVAFMLGSGERTTRNVYPLYTTEILASPYNQIEFSRSASIGEITEDELRGETQQLYDAGKEALAESVYKQEITFKPLQTPKSLYGEHYKLGDFVSVSFEHFSQKLRITGVNIKYDKSGNESIELVLMNVEDISVQLLERRSPTPI